MKRYNRYFVVLLFATAVLFVLCNRKERKDKVSVQPLQEWTFAYDGEDYTAVVPSFIHTDLMAHDLIADPYKDTNERACRWVSDSVWQYSTTFRLSDRKAHHDVVFAGLATRAEVYLNGHLIGKADNMFRAWRFVLDEQLQKGDNRLVVKFYPIEPYNDSCAAVLPYTLPDNRVFTRSAPYQQGWDWGPRLVTCGIWQPAWIEGWDEVRPEGTVHGEGMEGFFGAFGGDDEVMPSHPEVRLLRDSGEFCFEIEGEKVYMRGANWIPIHSFPVLDEAQKARYRRQLCAAKEANFNMIRVWGGGIYEPDYFYELCDSLGLYVWQDFDFSCALYPGDSAFLENVRIEAEEQVRRLSKHRCIVLWCGNNEVSNGWYDWGWQKQYGYTPEQEKQLYEDMEKLFGAEGVLAAAVKKYLPDMPYLPSSPVWGWGHDECVTDGDSHYWGVWWGELPFEMYREKTGRFMSEYGFQAYPSRRTVDSFFSASEPQAATAADLLVHPSMANHQKHARGTAIIDQMLQRYYGVTSHDLCLDDYLYLSQLCQAYGTGMGIEAHRIRKGHCWGTLFWQLNDCWPVASWSSVDYYGRWKALQYEAKRLFEPLAVLSEPAKDDPRAVDIYVVADNDLKRGQNISRGELYLRLYDFEGKLIDGRIHEVQLHPDKASEPIRYTLPCGVEAGEVVLKAEYAALGSKWHFFVSPKQLKLPQATIQTSFLPICRGRSHYEEGAYCMVKLQTDVFAYGVELSIEPDIPGRFEDDYFHWMPQSEPGHIQFYPDDPTDPRLDTAKIKVKCLNDVLQR